MRELVRGVAIANRARMLPHAGVFLLVEGVDDARLFRAFVDEAACKVLPVYGKPHVLEALESLRRVDPRVVVAILDADFMVLDGDAPDDADIVLTDHHDVEAMLLDSPALERLLGEYGHDRDDARPRAPEVRERLLALGIHVGLLRWLNHREANFWLFEEMNFDRFVDDRELDISRDDLLGEIQRRSRRGALAPEVIWPRAEALRAPDHDGWHICCGHDLVTLLGIGLRRVWGTNRPEEVTRARVERSLRLAYHRDHFASTRLHAALRRWEAAHVPYRIF